MIFDQIGAHNALSIPNSIQIEFQVHVLVGVCVCARTTNEHTPVVSESAAVHLIEFLRAVLFRLFFRLNAIQLKFMRKLQTRFSLFRRTRRFIHSFTAGFTVCRFLR